MRRHLVRETLPWLLVALTVGGCTASVELRVRAGRDDCDRDFGSSTAAQKIEAFLEATAALHRHARRLEHEARTACESGLDAAEQLVQRGTRGEPPCARLGAWIREESAALSAPPTIALSVPECTRSRSEFAACVSRCELRYRPEDIHVVDDGTGALTAPQVSPRCRAACETLSAIEESCTARTSVVEEAREDDALRRTRLRTALEHGARAIELAWRAGRIKVAAERLIAIAPVLPEAAATISVRAVACVSSASRDVHEADQRLDETLADGAAIAGAPSIP